MRDGSILCGVASLQLLLASEKPTRMPACLPKSSTEAGGPFVNHFEPSKNQWKHGHTSIDMATMNKIAPLIQQPKYRLKLSWDLCSQ
ncbi:hypothetical protein MRX96_025479 [Rhipicephalus microplus]